MNPREKPFIVPVFIPQQGCRHRCIFCNQSAVTGRPFRIPSLDAALADVHRFLSYNRKKKESVLAFYGGNFLGLPSKNVHELLEFALALKNGDKIHGVRFSTRPDTVSEEALRRIKNYPVSTVELGVQSLDEDVLKICRRGHTGKDCEHAVDLLKSHGFIIGLQMMIGLPGQGPESAWETARKICALSPDFVRIYPAVVLKGSVLASWLQNGKFTPLTVDEAILETKNIYRLFKTFNIPVVRMGLQSSPEMDDGKTVLAGPYHPAFGHFVRSAVYFDAICRFFHRSPPKNIKAQIHCNPKRISQIRGDSNSNINRIKDIFGIDNVTVTSDRSLGEEELIIDGQTVALDHFYSEVD